MKQYDIILKAMLNNKEKVKWKASDFQKEPYFVGYEASPRMSELSKMYPELIKTGKEGRYRTISINWECENIEEYLKEYKQEPKTSTYEMRQSGLFKLIDGVWKHIPRID